MVSLIPRDTYKGRNGLRQDLAEKIAALDPGFVRFPGGCLVNTGSHCGYDAASNWERARSYQWKDTIGPVEQRATNANFWGYNQSYGLGYYEYFQFSEDIGAMALPVVPALVTGCGQNRATDDDALLQRHIQDTLDLIEFANGPVDQRRGASCGRRWATRSRSGSPTSRSATRRTCRTSTSPASRSSAPRSRRGTRTSRWSATPGPDDRAATFDRLWKLNREPDVDMVDEHYYNSPAWFLQNNDRYDSYDRKGPKVFLGEYASQDNSFYNALAEAAYMTGLERNADIVRLASYAPLLANKDYVQWRPDMIWFDNHASWGSASYEVQKLFMNNVGDKRGAEHRDRHAVAADRPITGAVGLSTWATAAAYDDVKVTAPDGTALFADDFSADAAKWTHVAAGGTWAVPDGQYVQSDAAAENTMVTAGDTGLARLRHDVKATKTVRQGGLPRRLRGQGHRQLLLVEPRRLEQHPVGAVEKAADGGKSTLVAKAGHHRDRAARTTSGPGARPAGHAVPGRRRSGAASPTTRRSSRSARSSPATTAPAS